MPRALSNSFWIAELMGSDRIGSRGARVAGGGRGVEGEVEDEVEGEVLCG